MARFLLYLVAASLISVSAAVYEDCEVPPTVENAHIKIEDEEDTIKAIYTCQTGYTLQGPNELVCDLDSDEWNSDPPECLKQTLSNEVESNENVEKVSVEKPKKKKQQDIPEDRMVSPALASTLDMTCVQAKVKAPEIRHGFVQKYDRRRRVDKVFLVALYSCNDNFEFEDSEIHTLYCSERKWVGELPVCISVSEYAEGEGDEYEDYETVEEDDEEGEDVVPQPPPPPPTQPQTHVEKEISNEIPDVEPEQIQPVSSSETTNKIAENTEEEGAKAVTDINVVVEPTKDPYTPRVLDYNCGVDNGGCDQKCERVLFPGENEARIKCSCSSGFSLDPYDYSKCHDIDECAISNGGCEQSCENLPGSFQCTCESGLQIDTLTGNTCIDINECELPEIAAECQTGCENTHGSYRCITPLNSREDAEESVTESKQDSHEDSEIIRKSEVLECGEGYRAQEDKCVDIDECTEGTSGCEMCLNIEGGYECTCAPGFELAENEKTCIDIDECSIVTEENHYEAAYKICSHGCQNTIGSFYCSCPERQHISNDRRTCVADSCNDLQNSELNKTRCSYDCVDLSTGSYQCLCPEGYKLTEDGYNCQEMENICAQSKCEPGTCQVTEDGTNFICVCPLGYDGIDKKCLDIDECALGSHKCTHECANTEGGYYCKCPEGFQFAEGSEYDCLDINECLAQENICAPLNCVNFPGGFNCLCSDGSEPNLEGICSNVLQDPCTDHQCSHECISDGKNIRCACPGNMILDSSGNNCVVADICANNKNGCEQMCNSKDMGSCSCYNGFNLDDNGKSCQDIDECQINNGGCHQLCTNLAGSYACACEAGFELAEDQRTCLDIDECSLGRHDCSHGCVNIDGGFQCTCPDGYYLGEKRTTCLDIDECIVTNHGCSHNCYNTMGSYMCSCPDGFTLSEDDKKCISAICSQDNGGCSHLCDPEKGCVCPLGLTLSADGKTCEDINECLANNGGCTYKCVNTETSFECLCPDGSKPANSEDNCPITCPAGFTFNRNDPSKCEDIDECSLPGVCQYNCHNTNGSYECLCPTGYRLQYGRDCIDINECSENNGGCAGGECINHNGGFECKCQLGYALAADRKTCEKRLEMRDQCHPFEAPINGEIHCTKYRHKKKRFYNTKCKVWCNQGYRLEGPSQRFCNASGQWDDYQNQCLPIVCPRIPIPQNGVILPQSCSLGTTYMGEHCRLKCNVGYVPVGKTVSVCTSQMQWSYDGSFECSPIHTETRLGTRNDFTPLALPTVPTRLPLPSIPSTFNTRPLPGYGWKPPTFGGSVGGGGVGVQRPYIKCPRNTTVFLATGERTAHIILEKPITNMDYRYIESSPAWTKNLQAHLGAGNYAVVFRGHDPITGRKARCKTVINVRYAQGPEIEFCTTSFEVTLAENQAYRSVVWEEPRFIGKMGGIKKIYKSRLPGELFGTGIHTVYYEATSEDGLTAKCEFKITVKDAKLSPKPSMPSIFMAPSTSGTHSGNSYNLKYTNSVRPVPTVPTPISPVSHPSMPSAPLLAGHESFIICPGQKPVKVTQAQTVDLPSNCILKNVRLNPFRQFMSHRLMPRLWSSAYY